MWVQRTHTCPRLHANVVPVSVRLLLAVEKDDIHNCVKAGLPCSRAAPVLGATSNLSLKRTAARFVSENLEDLEPSGALHTPSKHSTTDNIGTPAQACRILSRLVGLTSVVT
jgi:hypothetical protein